MFHWIGFSIFVAADGITWFFTNGPMWALIGSWAAWICMWTAATVAVCIVISFILFKFSKSSCGQSYWDFVSHKFNGFKESRIEANERRQETAIKKAEIKIAIEKGDLPKPISSKLVTIVTTSSFCVGRGIKACFHALRKFLLFG